MRRALLGLVGGLIGGALAPFAVNAAVDGVRMIQAGGWVGTATSDLAMGSNVITFGSDPGDAGGIRLSHGDDLCLEADPTGTDSCISQDSFERFTFTHGVVVTGAVSATSTITSSVAADIGWAVVDGTDNTTCAAQCTNGAVFGLDLAAGAAAPVMVGPNSATADICLCAGSN